MSRVMRLAFSILLASVLFLPGAAAKLSQSAREWMNGPVKYLMTAEEKKLYKELTTEEEVQEFQKNFWAKRDPLPETPENEFQREFQQRVEQADRNFKVGSTGWNTDRGMVFVLLGPPQEVEDNPLGADISQGASQVWTYAYVIERRKRTDYRIFFYDQDGNGNYQLWQGQDLPVTPPANVDACDVDFKDPHLTGLDPSGREWKAAAPPPPAAGAAAAGTPAAGAAAAGAQPAPAAAVSKATGYIERLLAGESFSGAVPLVQTIHFFKDDIGTTLFMLTLGVKGSQAVVPFARLVSAQDSTIYCSFENPQSFVAWEGNEKVKEGFRLFQTECSVAPGSYKLYGGVYEESTGTVVSFTRDLEVPNYHSGAFSLSSVVLADEIKGDPSRSGSERKSAKPFTIGGTTVIPNIDEVYGKDQELALFFQAYDGQKAVETDQYNFHFEYRFYYEAGGSYRPYAGGRPVVVESDTPGQGYFLPLATMRPGKYKLAIKGMDQVAGTEATQIAFFTVAE